MKRKRKQYCLWGVIFSIVLFGISGCVTVPPTKPNTTYNGIYPSSIVQLSRKNSQLVNELGKLPDIQNGITDAEAEALERIVTTYNNDSAAFDHAFNIMYRVGNPEVRRYCTLLEAYFWYALEHDTDQMLLYLSNYHRELINDRYPFLETITVYNLLTYAWDFRDKERWNDPQTVLDRLNAPEIVEFWFGMRFIYDWGKFYHPAPIYGQSAEISIRTRKGLCYDAANLVRECLLAGGYKAKGLNILLARGGRIRGHSVCVVEIETPEGVKLYKLGDTRRPGSIGSIPYESYRAMALDMAKEYGRPLDTYSVGLPAFHRN